MNDVIVESAAIVHQVIIANFVDNIFCIIHCGRLRHNMPTRVVIDNKSFTRLEVYWEFCKKKQPPSPKKAFLWLKNPPLSIYSYNELPIISYHYLTQKPILYRAELALKHLWTQNLKLITQFLNGLSNYFSLGIAAANVCFESLYQPKNETFKI